ncbi:MAG TPA: histidine kinase, partial [Blastocatellia bacterium]|nr:histidine kinase [Blastocatellia bacterium]
NAMLKRRQARMLFFLLAWTLFGVFLASQAYIAYNRREFILPWYKALFVSMTYAYTWAGLTPLILWLSRRFRIEPPHLARNISVHLLASAVIAFTTRLQHDLLLRYALGYFNEPIRWEWMLKQIYLIFDYGMMTYGLILIVNYAMEYHRRYREGELRATRLEARLAQAQLQALKMQLHPHFLFNTLNSISALLHKNINAADTMIARLGDFLRLTLENSGAQEVSLREEIDFLKCYLEIERIRFQDRLTVSLDIEPATLDARLPNLILQPIVENAIRHGIAPRSGPGFIGITARHQDGLLQVQVRDNGPGLPPSGRISREGVGLANTQERLRQLYGASYRLDLENAPQGGLMVTLEIPYKLGSSTPSRNGHPALNGSKSQQEVAHELNGWRRASADHAHQ